MSDSAETYADLWDTRHGGRKGKRRPHHRVRLDRSRLPRSKHVTWEEDETVAAINQQGCGHCGATFYKAMRYCNSCDWDIALFGAPMCYHCDRFFDMRSTACPQCPRSFKRYLRESEEEATRFIWDAVDIFTEEERCIYFEW